ncbi:M48 family metallopeptidase [Opitutales bacterium]|uniref:M48 family metallopeptidase n=1 Tax=Candidatus Seribacter sulfatis TaxID=3381756 RepID=UPI00230D1F25|nr:M48 family metallopeptidase [Opitutales bacterium]
MKDRVEEIVLSELDPNFKISCLIRKSNRARRINLRIRSREKAVLTLPRWTSYREGLSFLSNQKKWLEQKIKTFPVTQKLSEYFIEGGQIWINKSPIFLSWSVNNNRKKVFSEVLEDALQLDLPTTDTIENYLFKFLRELARENLKSRLFTLAAKAELNCENVRIGNQRSRWGSCSARSTISLNWRLILLPYEIADYVIFHELAHLKHLNHSLQFWEYLEYICPNSRVYDKELLKAGKNVIRLGHID